MQRKDRETDKNFAFDVIDKCKYAVISMVMADNNPYAVPVSIVRLQQNIYFHSAVQGQKTDAILYNPNVCVVCVGDTTPQKDKFTVEYESAIVCGKVTMVEDDDEKLKVMYALCMRHTPENMEKFSLVADKALKHTTVWKIVAETITGKCNKSK